MKNLIKNFSHIIICIIMLSLVACGKQESIDVNTVSVTDYPSGQVMAATLEGTGFTLPMAPALVGSTLYYMEGTWNNDTESYINGAIYKIEKGEQKAVEIGSFGDNELLLYFVGSDGTVYSLYRGTQDAKEEVCLRKYSVDGETIYDVLVTDKLRHVETITMGQAGTSGEVCLSNFYGEIFLFNADGQYICMGKAPWDKDSYNGSTCGLANAGRNGIFTYFVNRNSIAFQEIDFTNGKMGAVQEIQLVSNGNLSVEIFDGYDRGIFFSDGDILWNYETDKAEASKVLSWSDSAVNLKGYMIDALGVLETGLITMVHQSPSEVYFAQIVRKDRAELVEKQMITLGVVGNEGIVQSELEEMASAFNRESTSYEITFEFYNSFMEFQEKLIKGEGPDLISLSAIDITVLSDKGVLEDLTPYFAESNIIKKEDLLPAVQRAGTVNDIMCCVLPDFQVSGFLVEKGTAEGNGWNADQFLDMGENNPNAALVFCLDYKQSYPMEVLGMVLDADLGSYLNFTDRECCFDDGRFASLMERIVQLGIPPLESVDMKEIMASGQSLSEIMKERFYQKEVLVYRTTVSSLDSYQDAVAEMGEISEWIGYPTVNRVPYNEMISNTPLGINHASDAKEGAWAFLEFLLSEKYQDRKNGFPVRQDSFEKYLEQTEMFNGIVQIKLTEEDKEILQTIIEHAYWMQAKTPYDISHIIYEEAGAVFAGDKTSEEAAEIIQRRVQLYIQE